MVWLFSRNSSTAGDAALTTSAQRAALPYGHDWGTPPDGPSEREQDSQELILQTWAFCKAKKDPLSAYRTESDERARKKLIGWRKRASFLQLNCGEDSFMVSNTYRAIAVADGVGGWREKGVDPAIISNKLMENCKLYSETHRDVFDARAILTEAYKKLSINKEVQAGSTTACVVCLRPGDTPHKGILDIANLGDSGAILIRNRSVVQRAHEKVHFFNAPFQLAVLPPRWAKGKSFQDSPSDCIREQWPVEEGDVVVLGTDGLFDNLSVSRIADDAGWVGAVEGTFSYIPYIGDFLNALFGASTTSYVDPYRVAQRLVNEAWNASTSKDSVTPFALTLQDMGVRNGGKGGKPDDITILVSRVVNRSEMKRVPMW